MVRKALLGQVGDTEVRLLKVFKSVVDCGGMAAAELELNIGRSTVSRHVKDLEERLGLVLCRRGRAGFALTDEGQRVYDDALRLLDALDGFRTSVAQMHDELVGSLQIGLFDKTATNPQARIDQAIREFRRIAPEVALEITVGALNSIEPGVMDGRLQLGIVPDHRRSDSMSYAPLFSEAMFLYCGRQHPLFGARHEALNLKELQEYDYAGLGFHSPNMEVTHRFRLRRHASVTDQEAIATLILSGCYIGFLPDHYAASFLAQGLMQRIDHPQCTYRVDFVAITRRSPRPSRIAQAFLDALHHAHPG
ncbi:MAG: LysR family transcriptional regulator [Burkholderiaceae bacterium]